MFSWLQVKMETGKEGDDIIWNGKWEYELSLGMEMMVVVIDRLEPGSQFLIIFTGALLAGA